MDALIEKEMIAEIERLKTENENLKLRLEKAGKYLQEIREHGDYGGGTSCSAHAFLAIGNAILPI